MPPPASRKPLPKPRQQAIDIYNPTSTGHQAGSAVSKPISWHKSRFSKLQQQFRNNPHSQSMIGIPPVAAVMNTASTLVASSRSSAARSPHPLVSPEAEDGNPNATAIAGPVITQAGTSDLPQQQGFTNQATLLCAPTSSPHTHTISTTTRASTVSVSMPKPTQPTPTAVTRIFTNCTIYVNGTTAPAISDLVLKRLLCTHGASIALARRSVTHVILGKPSSVGGAGGGLAAGKLQKELMKIGKPIKFVSVEWALDSVKAGKRLSETNYTVLNMHSQSQRSIKGFAKAPLVPNANADSTGFWYQ